MSPPQPPARAITDSLALRWIAALGVFVVAAVWFGTLGARHLVPSDEGRYAEIARELAATGDWVTIRYNGLKYFEKPPLHLWATAVTYTLFGVGQWQARLWVALGGALGIVLTMFAARRWWGPRAALLSGLVMLAMPTWNISAHFNSLDMSVSAALAAVLACVLIAQHPDTAAPARRRWMAAAWIAMALAVLTKGLIGIVLPGLALLLYTACSRDLALWRRLHFGIGVPLFLIVAVPWFWLVAARNPEFMQFFFVHEHFERYTTTVHHHAGPVWYFMPQLIAGMLPWTGLWPGMAAAALKATPRDAGLLQPERLLAAWVVVIFVFFSLSGSKLPGYILPVFPALALLAARALAGCSDRSWRRQLVAALVAGVLLALAAPFTVRFATADTPAALYRAYAPWLVAAALTLIAGAAAALELQRRGRRLGSIAAYALGCFLATTLGLLGHETLGRAKAGAELVAPMRALLRPGMPVYAVRLLDHTLPFYLGRTFTLVEGADELEFGTQQEPDKWLPTLDAFRQRWQHGPQALAVMSPDTFELLHAQGLPLREVARSSRRVVAANFPATSP